jgi:hypothetical protein
MRIDRQMSAMASKVTDIFQADTRGLSLIYTRPVKAKSFSFILKIVPSSLLSCDLIKAPR